MGEMVERCMRKLRASGYEGSDDDLREDVRAVIEELREPTLRMVQSGGHACQDRCDLTIQAARQVWPAMIDAALKEEG